MKKWIAVALVAVFLSACTSSTQYGSCVGVSDDKKPNLEYKVDAWNVFLAVVFFQTVFVPIIVLVNETSCPVGIKTPEPATITK